MRWCVLAGILAGCAVPAAPASAPLSAGVADDGDPAVVAITYASDPSRLRCTGTLIDERVVLTAAHCGAQDDPSTYEVMVGSLLAASSARIAILAAVAHPEDDGSADRDLALLLLAEAPAVAPIALLGEPPVLGSARLVGFGLTAPMAADDSRKREGTAEIAETMPEHLVLGAAPSLPCNGDSGGPVLVATASGERLAAVISRGDAACSATARATRVDPQLETFVGPQLAAWAPASAALGESCLYDAQCASGLCVAALDEPALRFCGAPCDGGCAAPLTCEEGLCRHPRPSPGALGSACAEDADCLRGDCLEDEAICSVRCITGTDDCAPGFACTHLGSIDFYCVPEPSPSCDVRAARSSPSTWLVALALALALGIRSTTSARARARRRR